MSDQYTICQNAESLQRCLRALRSPDVAAVMFDCEGENLGNEGGTLAIISLRVCKHSGNHAQTFLVDVLSVPDGLLRQLLFVLAVDTPLKVVFDGRMDFTELFFTYQIRPAPLSTLDLQLVDIMNRKDNYKEQRQRLLRLFPPKVVFQSENRGIVSKIILINGLGGCISEHQLNKTDKKGKLDHSRWLERPLPSDYWAYAAKDVVLIERLYLAFQNKGFLSLHRMYSYLFASHRYITMWFSVGKAIVDDPLRNHPILAMDILEETTHRSKICSGCRRRVSKKNFGRGGLTCATCWILEFKRPKKTKSQETSPKQEEEGVKEIDGELGRVTL